MSNNDNNNMKPAMFQFSFRPSQPITRLSRQYEDEMDIYEKETDGMVPQFSISFRALWKKYICRY